MAKKKYHCYSCDKESPRWKDFNDCTSKNHEVLEILNDETKDSRSESKKLYDFANTLIEKLVIDDSNQTRVYAVVIINDQPQCLDLASSKAIHWLSYELRKLDLEQIRGDDFFKNILHAIISDAQMGNSFREKIYHRICQKPDEIYYDLGTNDGYLVRISKNSVKTIQFDKACPLFTRPPSLQPQVVPKFKDKKALEKITDLLLILDKDRILFQVHLISFFLENIPVPIAVADGESGSIKTTFTTCIKRVVDPNGPSRNYNYVSFPAKSDDLDAICSNRYMMCFDNVSSIDQTMSDKLCISITGGSSASRQFYTNNEENIINYRNKIVLNGIIPKLDYPDLQTRLINYQRKDLDSVPRITEKGFEETFQQILPDVLGLIFKTLQKAMKIYPKITKRIKPVTRMADFEIWGEAISQSLGNTENVFHNEYVKKLEEDFLGAKDQHIVAQIIDEMMQKTDSIKETVNTLHNTIKAIAIEKEIPIENRFVHFPKLANQLSKELKVISPILSKLGYKVTMNQYTSRDGKYPRNSMIVSISKRETQQNLEISIPKIAKNHKSHGKGGKDGKSKSKKQGLPKEYFKCMICDAGPFHISEKSQSSGSILNFHKKANHKIKYLSQKEVKDLELKKNLFQL